MESDTDIYYDEEYELYGRCAICCLPGAQWAERSRKRFICIVCSEAKTQLPIPTGEWYGECSLDNVIIRLVEDEK